MTAGAGSIIGNTDARISLRKSDSGLRLDVLSGTMQVRSQQEGKMRLVLAGERSGVYVNTGDRLVIGEYGHVRDGRSCFIT